LVCYGKKINFFITDGIRGMKNLHNYAYRISRQSRNQKNRHISPVIWFTGLSGSGKSTLANALETYLFNEGYKTYVLDGDNVRMGLNKDLGFSDNDRKENIRRISEVANLFTDSGTLTITAFISPFKEDRNLAREILGKNFIEIWVKADLETCESRDPKGLYKKARLGEIKNFTGIDSPYEEPENPELTIDTSELSIEDSIDKIISYLNKKINIWPKTNHGGDPTNNTDEKRAIFIGRYQPYHFGHIQLIQQKLNEGIGALIMVRDIEPDEKNPFTTEQTVDMIQKYHAAKGDDVKVIIIPDIESVNYGRGVGYEINEFTPPDNIGFISATKIRESIFTGNDEWKSMVDSSIQYDVVKYLLENEKGK
jgi:adenylylsulfate kinase